MVVVVIWINNSIDKARCPKLPVPPHTYPKGEHDSTQATDALPLHCWQIPVNLIDLPKDSVMSTLFKNKVSKLLTASEGKRQWNQDQSVK
jgi:hypothetical protein